MTEPTDDELAKLFTEETGFDVDDFPAAILDFARAALRSWGQPSGAGDGRMSEKMRDHIKGMSVSVDVSTGDHDAGNRYFGTVTEVMDDIADKHGVVLLVQDAEPNFAPQPNQAVPPAGREPLTVEQVNAILLEAGYGSYNAPVPERAAFISGLRHSERAHGIGETP